MLDGTSIKVSSTDPSLIEGEVPEHLQNVPREALDVLGVEGVSTVELSLSEIREIGELSRQANPFRVRYDNELDLSSLGQARAAEILEINRKPTRGKALPRIQRSEIKTIARLAKDGLPDVTGRVLKAMAALQSFKKEEFASLQEAADSNQIIDVSELEDAYLKLGEFFGMTPSVGTIRMIETLWDIIDKRNERNQRKINELSNPVHTPAKGFFRALRVTEKKAGTLLRHGVGRQRARVEKIISDGTKVFEELKDITDQQQVLGATIILDRLYEMKTALSEEGLEHSDEELAVLAAAEQYLIQRANECIQIVQKLAPNIIQSPSLKKPIDELALPIVSHKIEQKRAEEATGFSRALSEANNIIVGGRRLKQNKRLPEPQRLIDDLDRLFQKEPERHILEKGMIAAIVSGRFTSFVETVQRVKEGDVTTDTVLATLWRNRATAMRNVAETDLGNSMETLETLVEVYSNEIENLLGSDNATRIKNAIDRFYNRPVPSETQAQTIQEPVGRDELLSKVFSRNELIGELDWTVLPKSEDGADASLEQTAREIVAEAQERAERGVKIEIDLTRLNILKNLREFWGKDRCEYFRGTLRNKGATASSDRPDEYIVVVLKELDAHGNVTMEHAVAESPIVGEHAVYVLRGDVAAGSWREVFSLPKPDALDLGARKLKHTKGDGRPMVDLLTERAATLLRASTEDFFRIRFQGSSYWLRKMGSYALSNQFHKEESTSL